MRKVVVWGIVVVILGVLIGVMVFRSNVLFGNEEVLFGGGNEACSSVQQYSISACGSDPICLCPVFGCEKCPPEPFPIVGPDCSEYENEGIPCYSGLGWEFGGSLCQLARKLNSPDKESVCPFNSCPIPVVQFGNQDQDPNEECCELSISVYCAPPSGGESTKTFPGASRGSDFFDQS